MTKVTKEKNMSMNDVINIETEEGNLRKGITLSPTCLHYFRHSMCYSTEWDVNSTTCKELQP